MFRLNFWPRPLINNNSLSPESCPQTGSGQSNAENHPTPSGALDYTVSSAAVAAAVASGSTGRSGGGSFFPLSMAASPALMALASSGHQDGSHVAVAALALQAARAARSSAQRSDDILADSKERGETSTPIIGGTGNHQHHHGSSSNHHAAFGSTGPFPFYRQGQGVGNSAAESTLSPALQSHHPHHQQQHQQLPQQHHLPPLFSHLHHTLLRSHLDSAAVQAAAAHIQHQARLGAAALFGQRLASAAAAMAAAASSQHGAAASGGSAGNGYRSAFAPAAGRKSSSSSSSACSRNTSIYHGSQHQHHHKQQHQHPSHDMPSTAAAASCRSRRYSGDERMSDDETPFGGGPGDVIAQSPVGSRGGGSRRHAISGGVRSRQRDGWSSPTVGNGPEVADDNDGNRVHQPATLTGSPNSPQLSYDADSDLMSDHMSSIGDRVTPIKDQNASHFKGGHNRWSMTSEDGTGDVQCPVCRQLVHVDDLEHHLIQEFAELQQMYKSSIHLDSSAGSSHHVDGLNGVRRANSARDVTSKSRYDTFMRIRNNRENRLAKIRSRRKRLHDEILLGQQHLQQHRPPLNGHRDSSANGLFFQQRESNVDEDTMVDVIGFEEQEKENDWIKTNATTTINNNQTDCCNETVYKQMEDKSTKTDDVIVSADSKSVEEHRGVVCAVCMQTFVDPLISVQCWHVHCERCWQNALGTKSSCPQCDVTTTTSSLQRIHI